VISLKEKPRVSLKVKYVKRAAVAVTKAWGRHWPSCLVPFHLTLIPGPLHIKAGEMTCGEAEVGRSGRFGWKGSC